MLQGRRTAIDCINGLVAAQGEDVGVPAPTHLVQRVALGEIEIHPRYVEGL